MKKTGEWGHFLDARYSPFGYNETIAQEQYPLQKEEALALGFNWSDSLPGTFGKETLTSENIQENINEVAEDITKKILVCTVCKKNYNVIIRELAFYRARSIPIPRECPNCRHAYRMNQRGKNTLFHRQCMCEKTNHNHSGRCTVEFETTYSPPQGSGAGYTPDRPELVYCETCYQKEVV